jgi:hypothetical protein
MRYQTLFFTSFIFARFPSFSTVRDFVVDIDLATRSPEGLETEKKEVKKGSIKALEPYLNLFWFRKLSCSTFATLQPSATGIIRTHSNEKGNLINGLTNDKFNRCYLIRPSMDTSLERRSKKTQIAPSWGQYFRAEEAMTSDHTQTCFAISTKDSEGGMYKGK